MLNGCLNEQYKTNPPPTRKNPLIWNHAVHMLVNFQAHPLKKNNNKKIIIIILRLKYSYTTTQGL